jgi:O-antigen ligase
MLTKLATAGCLLFIGYLFWADVKKRKERPISWVPLIWMFLAGSRWVSSWLSMSMANPLVSVDDYAEGSPIDRAVFFGLILAGAFVLSRRRNVNWGQLLTRNIWIVLYLLYCLSSVAWTDEPFILVKRWIKDLGNPIMALVILTEDRPYEAVGITLRRLAFLLLPLSVLFVKYIPDLGRTYHVDGSPMYVGVGHQKNDLGLMCLTSGIYFAWKLLQKRGAFALAEKTDIFDFLLIAMLVWLLRMSDSQTSVACLVTAVALLSLAKVPFIARKPSRIVTILVIGALSYSVLDATVHIRDVILGLLGRDPSLTNRTELWEVVRRQEANAWVGAGFMSFWAGDRMKAIWEVLGRGINQAHNGYLEQYLNLGYIGVAFIATIMFAALLRVRKELDTDPAAGMLRLCFLVAAVLYNYTEASFYGINNMWVMLLLGCIGAAATPIEDTGRPATLESAEPPAPMRFAGWTRPRNATETARSGWQSS